MVFRKTYTMRIPPGAEIVERDGQRIARWRLRNGQRRSAEVVDCQDGKQRVRGQSRYFIARYRDGAGHTVDVPTRCRDEVAARAVLADLERRAELVRAGVISADENNVTDHARIPLSKHYDAYERHLRAKGGDPRRISMLRSRLDRLARECVFSKLGRMTADAVERWLSARQDENMAAATRNCYRESLVGFANWCVRTRRMIQNPFLHLPRADQRVDRPHERRALTADELGRLLTVARWRPLAEYGRELVKKRPSSKRSKKSRATWTRRPLTYDDLDAAVVRGREALKENPAPAVQLEREGRERQLIYLTLVTTGLRKSELASLTVGQLELDDRGAYAVLQPKHEKNRQGSNIPIRADVAAELRSWLQQRLSDLQAECRSRRRAIPARLPPDEPLFHVPSGLTRVFDRDLAVAGIPKRDERNRVVDIHALRVTFGTHLCVAGVPLRVAQAAMRHSKPELTARIYVDPKLLDVAGAIESLPTFSPPAQPARTTADATAAN